MERIDVYDDCFDEEVAHIVNKNLHPAGGGLQEYHQELPSFGWNFGGTSIKGKGDNSKETQMFWMMDISSRPEKYKMLAGFADEIFEALKVKFDFKEKYNVEEYQRTYMNAHHYGLCPNIHTDDGQWTMIYYPRMDWKREWGGGTSFYKKGSTVIDGQVVEGHTHQFFTPDRLDKIKTVDYVGNRLCVFDARILHGAEEVDRQCYDCLLYTSPSPRDGLLSRMPSSA